MTGEQYLRAVEASLADLPWRARKTLAEDLRLHLRELPPDEDLVARLGSPDSYAAELRTAADLEPTHGPIAFVRARRPRNVVITIVLIGLVSLLVAAFAWVRSYQPVRTGWSAALPLDSHDDALGETVVVFRNGQPFRYGFSIRNSGRFAVRIIDVPLGTFRYPFKVRVYISRAQIGATGPYAPFHQVTLKPGTQRIVLLRGRYTDCRAYDSNGGLTVFAFPVRTRFLRWTHTVQVPLSEPLVIKMPKTNPCSSP